MHCISAQIQYWHRWLHNDTWDQCCWHSHENEGEGKLDQLKGMKWASKGVPSRWDGSERPSYENLDFFIGNDAFTHVIIMAYRNNLSQCFPLFGREGNYTALGENSHPKQPICNTGWDCFAVGQWSMWTYRIARSSMPSQTFNVTVHHADDSETLNSLPPL